jgi:hypothetical protein
LSEVPIERSLFGDPESPRYADVANSEGFMETIKSMIMADLQPHTRYEAAYLYDLYLGWFRRARRRGSPISQNLFGRNLPRIGFVAVRRANVRYWLTPS